MARESSMSVEQLARRILRLDCQPHDELRYRELLESLPAHVLADKIATSLLGSEDRRTYKASCTSESGFKFSSLSPQDSLIFDCKLLQEAISGWLLSGFQRKNCTNLLRATLCCLLPWLFPQSAKASRENQFIWHLTAHISTALGLHALHTQHHHKHHYRVMLRMFPTAVQQVLLFWRV